MCVPSGRSPVVVELYPFGAANAAGKIALITSLDSIDVIAATFRAIAHASIPGEQQMVFLVLISVLLRNSYTFKKATKRSMKICSCSSCTVMDDSLRLECPELV